MDRNRDRRELLTRLISLALVGLFVCALCLFRTRVLFRDARMETSRYLGEISEHITDLVEERVNAIFLALETTAEHLGQEAGTVRAHELYLDSVARRYGFLRIGMAKLGGNLKTTDGYEIPLEQLPGIRRAMEGEEAVSDMVCSQVDGEQIMIYGVPIRQNGVVTGVLAASFSQTALRDYLSVESFEGAGISTVINSQGEILATNQSDWSLEKSSFFDKAAEGSLDRGYSLEQMRMDMAARRTGQMGYTFEDGVHKLMTYAPMGIADWYLLTAVPESVATAGIRQYAVVEILVDAAIVLLFLALILMMTREYRHQQENLEHMAFSDPVTGGRNRAYFTREAERLIRTAPPGTYVLVSADVVKFKLINDTFGSEMGDRTLKHIHDVMADSLREGELMARISGDLFKLLLKNGETASLERRLREMVEKINAFNDERREKYFLTVAAGVCIVDEPGVDIVTIQGCANEARERAKQEKPGGVFVCAFYSGDARSRALREKDIENRMAAALERGEFEVFLQPKVELRWDTVAGAEALVRWRDPERGLLLPDEFIPLFERNGFVVRVDRFIFERVCALQRKWLDAGRKPIPISVNLSRGNLEHPDFLEEYIRIRDRYRIPDGLLELEITETLFQMNETALAGVMREIRQAGFLCSMDDFGSGYSSLGLLKAAPVDTLKLDRNFFAGSGRDLRGEYVVESVLELARKLKMSTVCEGVESLGQLNFLRKARCDMVQGYIFSGPLEVDGFEALAFSGRSLTPKIEAGRL